VDESADAGQRHAHRQDQRGLAFCLPRRKQIGQPVAAVAPLVVGQCPPGVGQGYQGRPPVSGVPTPVSRSWRSSR
jgi:hypothetical protein